MDPGFFRYLAEIFLDLRHGGRNVGEPDIEMVVALIVVGHPGMTIHGGGEIGNPAFRDVGRTGC